MPVNTTAKRPGTEQNHVAEKYSVEPSFLHRRPVVIHLPVDNFLYHPIGKTSPRSLNRNLAQTCVLEMLGDEFRHFDLACFPLHASPPLVLDGRGSPLAGLVVGSLGLVDALLEDLSIVVLIGYR